MVLQSLGESPAAHVDPLLGTRHRDRDYGLRRALLAADSLGLIVALVVALAISGRRDWRSFEVLGRA